MISLGRKNDRGIAVFASRRCRWLRNLLEGCLFRVERVLDGAVGDRVITRLFAGHPGERGYASGLCLTRTSVKTVLDDLPYRGGVIVIHGRGTGLLHVGRETWGDE